MGLSAAWGAISTALATGLYLSYIPVKLFGSRKWSGAGFLGAFEGLLLLPLLPVNPWSLAFFLAAAVVVSSVLCGKAEKLLGVHDDPRIILDEVVGLWVAAAFLPRTGRILAATFVLFRLFDSVKLPPYRWLERLPGGWGVVGDDVGAAIVANFLVRLLMSYFPWLIY